VTDAAATILGHWRLPCPTFLRQTFVEWAAESIRHSFWARAYDQQQRNKVAHIRLPSGHSRSHGSEFSFGVGSIERPMTESVYLSALQYRGSPLMHNLARGSLKKIVHYP